MLIIRSFAVQQVLLQPLLDQNPGGLQQDPISCLDHPPVLAANRHQHVLDTAYI